MGALCITSKQRAECTKQNIKVKLLHMIKIFIKVQSLVGAWMDVKAGLWIPSGNQKELVINIYDLNKQ